MMTLGRQAINCLCTSEILPSSIRKGSPEPLCEIYANLAKNGLIYFELGRTNSAHMVPEIQNQHLESPEKLTARERVSCEAFQEVAGKYNALFTYSLAS